ncbi:MAG: hypothetical protein B6U97_04955 [Candidatus Altiarchaeales archaeon ex4484_96]|nr:MAG: hypothetical protein B6U97_04955 [Candidatus Altiarchaeales archaeon ex4484_96]
MFEDILVPFIAVGLAELGDKTQLAVVLLSSKYKNHIQLFFGIILAFFVVDGVAILFGSWITRLFPETLLKIVSAVIFIFFGLLVVCQSMKEEHNEIQLKSAFTSGFTLIFLSEWGDKTQIASALFATQYNPLMVLVGAITALTVISLMAVYVGRFVSDRIDDKLISKIAGLIFILVGLLFLIH